MDQPRFERAVADFGMRTEADMVRLAGLYAMACMLPNSFGVDIEPAAASGAAGSACGPARRSAG